MIPTYTKIKEMIDDERSSAQEKYGHYCNYVRSQGFEPLTFTEFKSARQYFEGGIKKLTHMIHGGVLCGNHNEGKKNV